MKSFNEKRSWAKAFDIWNSIALVLKSIWLAMSL